LEAYSKNPNIENDVIGSLNDVVLNEQAYSAKVFKEENDSVKQEM